MTQTSPDKHQLAGRRVLIVEDEYFIADDLAQVLTRFGAEIVGPVATRDGALSLLATAESVDLAVLDINLRSESVFPVADVLTEQGVPFMFATGYDQASIPARHQHVPRWEKPFAPAALAQALPEILPNR